MALGSAVMGQRTLILHHSNHQYLSLRLSVVVGCSQSVYEHICMCETKSRKTGGECPHGEADHFNTAVSFFPRH